MSLNPFWKRLRPQPDSPAPVLPPAPAAKAELPMPAAPWWETSFCEHNLQFVLRDYCKPGGIAFDVGANAGELSILMSRLVGPRGVVAAFEASPRIVPITQHNLIQAGCGNVQVYHRAVHARSHERLPLFAGWHLNDSTVGHGPPDFQVLSAALDDFCDWSGLVPQVIKLDVEGAEAAVLEGMSRLLSTVRPIIIAEQNPEDGRGRRILADSGYLCMDTATYRPIRRELDFPEGVGVANLLFAPQERTAGDPYFHPQGPVHCGRWDRSAFRRTSEGAARMIQAVTLGPGRYILSADVSAEGRDNETYLTLEQDGRLAARFHTHTAMLASCYRDLVVHLDHPAALRLELSFVVGSDPSVDWRGVDVWRAPGFDGRRQTSFV